MVDLICPIFLWQICIATKDVLRSLSRRSHTVRSEIEIPLRSVVSCIPAETYPSLFPSIGPSVIVRAFHAWKHPFLPCNYSLCTYSSRSSNTCYTNYVGHTCVNICLGLYWTLRIDFFQPHFGGLVLLCAAQCRPMCFNLAPYRSLEMWRDVAAHDLPVTSSTVIGYRPRS